MRIYVYINECMFLFDAFLNHSSDLDEILVGCFAYARESFGFKKCEIELTFGPV